MTRPLPREDAVAFIRHVRFAHLATRGLDGGASVRPILADTVEGRVLYFCTYDTSRKVLEMERDAHVSIVWTDLDTMTQVRLFGTARPEQDEEVVERMRASKPLLAESLPPGAEDLFLLFRVEPEYVQWAEGVAPYRRVAW